MTTAPLVAVLFVLAAVSSSAAGRFVGGWHKIADPTDPKVQELARFAMAWHNGQSTFKLHYVAVKSGEKQLVSGVLYHLWIQASDPTGTVMLCETKVYDVPWTHFREVQFFKV